MQTDRDKNPGTGNKQSDFAGTNPDRYGPPKTDNQQNNPVEDEEAQNIIDGGRMEETDSDRNKANEGKEGSSENSEG